MIWFFFFLKCLFQLKEHNAFYHRLRKACLHGGRSPQHYCNGNLQWEQPFLWGLSLQNHSWHQPDPFHAQLRHKNHFFVFGYSNRLRLFKYPFALILGGTIIKLEPEYLWIVIKEKLIDDYDRDYKLS